MRLGKLIFGLLLCFSFSLKGQEMMPIKGLIFDRDIPEKQVDVLRQFFRTEVSKRVPNWSEAVDDSEAYSVHFVSKEFMHWPSAFLQADSLFALPLEAESYRILTEDKQVYIQGRDFRGLLFGLGHFLRKAKYADSLTFPKLNVAVFPEKRIRGHQIGYRNTANSYDAWTVEQYEQYIRDMIVFGANSLENIPFSEDSPIHFTLSNWDMNMAVSKICNRYDVDYWIWAPLKFDLNDKEKRQAFLEESARFFNEIERLDHVFVPGGDPGDNPPDLVLAMMKDLSILLQKKHPQAKMWMSLQGFDAAQCQVVYAFLKEQHPEWLGGLVGGPSSPPLKTLRKNLPKPYLLRDYPDITHTVRCQYPLWWWDPAFNFVLGREPVDPQPLRFQNIFIQTQAYTDGFVSYSDGIHDDLNKMLWSQLGMQSQSDLRDIVVDYANYFLSSPSAELAADALFALETNWVGAIKTNGGINATLGLWDSLSAEHNVDENWRWKMYWVRASLDAFIRNRFIYEEGLEQKANRILLQAKELGSHTCMEAVTEIYAQSAVHFKKNSLRKRIFELTDDLFESIGFQPSVPLYQARNPERGAYLDFIDRPLNNKWWVEAEFEKMAVYDESQKVVRLVEMGSWEEPGAGGFYDDVGNVYKSKHVIKPTNGESDPEEVLSDYPGFDWWDSGYNRSRLSWMSSMGWPYAMRYIGLDPEAQYEIVYTGVGLARIRANGVLLKGPNKRVPTGEKVTVPIPQAITAKGELELRWEKQDESHLNWRQHSRLNELWIIKK
ncbi:hypothetical protein LAG90_10145 [Marinilongibacter aquaticus]|uniref:hypothetical protein n=1 Tax=Marinilongibacter aquaticus TaxID=2975157 RepID=UPI0021BD0BD4|nr:hypothetical protein [Marinilongibacter aquaticus]UBM57181.1 hypothetical protein LAG90_10145 [Marinilongibacter aquaticus]